MNGLCVKFLICIIMQGEISTKHSVSHSHLQSSTEDGFWLWPLLIRRTVSQAVGHNLPQTFFFSSLHIQWQSYSPALPMQLVQTSINLENLLILLAPDTNIRE